MAIDSTLRSCVWPLPGIKAGEHAYTFIIEQILLHLLAMALSAETPYIDK